MTLSAHCLGHFDKATDISTLHIVDLITVLTEFNASVMNVFHNLRQFLIYLFGSPAISQ